MVLKWINIYLAENYVTVILLVTLLSSLLVNFNCIQFSSNVYKGI